MKFFNFFIVMMILTSCQKQSLKSNEALDSGFIYYDFFNQSVADVVDELSYLKIYVSRDTSFENRSDQIQFALDVTGYSLSMDLGDYDFNELNPSIFLSVNRLVNIPEYLRLAGFVDHQIVIDPVNKLIAYVRKGSHKHRLYSGLVDIPGEYEFEHVQISDDVDSVHLNDDSTNENVPVLNITTTHSENPDGDSIVNDIDVNLPDDTPLITISESPLVSDVGVDHSIFIEKNLSLHDIFNKVAESQNMDFVNSMGLNAWFLNSTINHSFHFDNLDHALSLLVAESNRILKANKIPFSLVANTNNNILEIYYE